MDNTTSIALSRLVAQQRSLDITATNIANAATPGFRATRAMFSDWLVKSGARSRDGDTTAYTQDRSVYRDARRGPLQATGNPLDIAVSAEGYFAVQAAQGVRLTRAGHFEVSAQGGVVDADGNRLLDTTGRELQLGPTDTDVSIAADGTISSRNGRIGRIGVVMPTNPGAVTGEGNRLFAATGPTEPVAAPRIVQGMVEGSNVEPTLELTRMMTDLREFQFTSQMIQAESDRQQGAIDKITARR